MKILLAPDSFKGTLTSTEICDIVSAELSHYLPDAEIISIPVADGGEGTLEAFNKARPGETVYAKATDSRFNEISAPYLFYEKSGTGFSTAVIESAKVAGFITPSTETASAMTESTKGKPAEDESSSFRGFLDTEDSSCIPDPTRTTTYGLGLLIRDALARGANKIIIGLGGSSTNDGGCGMAAALGTRFFNVSGGSFIDGKPFVPVGGTLSDIIRIDNRDVIDLLGGARGFYKGKAIDIIGMCDVTNPLCGEYGASRVFGPQKGASENDVELLDRGLSHLISLIDDIEVADQGSVLFPGTLSARKLSEMNGSGAAGGLGFGIRAFVGGRLEKGIDLMLDTVRFDEHLWNADWVITGEGRLDSQSAGGKVVSGVYERARNAGAGTVILCGLCDDVSGSCFFGPDAHIIETGPIDFAHLSKEDARKTAIENLIRSVVHIANLVK